MATTNDSTAGSRSPLADRAPTLGEQSKKVAEDVRELGSLAVAGASDALQAVKERGSQALEAARERGKAGVERARDGFEGYVSENPFKSILIAVGVGALLGYSLRSRN